MADPTKPGLLDRVKGGLSAFVNRLCERPDHLHRLAILFAGFSLYPAIVAMVAIIIWFGVTWHVTLALAALTILGNITYGILALFALVLVAILGVIRGINVTTPWGAGVDINMMEARTIPPSTTTVTTTTPGATIMTPVAHPESSL